MRAWHKTLKPSNHRTLNYKSYYFMGVPKSGLPKALERIRQAANRDRKMRFTSLWHHVYNIEPLDKAYYSLKRDAAPGVDGETWRDYGLELEGATSRISPIG